MSELRIFIDPGALLLGEGGREEWPDARDVDVPMGGDLILGKALPVIVSAELVADIRDALQGHEPEWLTGLAGVPTFCQGMINVLGLTGVETVPFRNLSHHADPLGIDLWLPRTIAAAVYPGDAVLWISTDAALYGEWLRAELPWTDLLIIAPDPDCGLSREQIVAIRAFATMHPVE